MIRRDPRSRAGITLTEILISILIMGVGLLSLATLFPLGLLRIREAARSSRSALLTQSAISEVSARNMLAKWGPNNFYGWYFYPGPPQTTFDPFVTDPAPGRSAGGVARTEGAGLPVAYDPLWWYQLMLATSFSTNPSNTEIRFADGTGYVRPSGNISPNADGLQRITNYGLTQDATGKLIFDAYNDPASALASPDDIVYLAEGRVKRDANGSAAATDTGSPILPDRSSGSLLVDYSYTWMLTVRQSDVTNDTIFDGDVVVSHNRPFAVNTVNPPLGGGPVDRAAGETVIEGVFGYGPGVQDPNDGNYYGNSDTAVLLRWPIGMPDPDVRIGGWIADVTYERLQAQSDVKFPATRYPGQRCYWYRIARRSEPTVDPTNSNYRQMIVTVGTSLRAKTRMTSLGSNVPIAADAALIGTHVVNVYPKVFYTR